MNDIEFEHQLRAIKPATPSAAFDKRIAAELALPAGGFVQRAESGWVSWFFPRLGWSALGAAVTLAISAFARTDAPVPAIAISIQPAVAVPTFVQRSAEILNASDEGITRDGELGIARQVRLTSIERSAWVDATGAEMLVEIPREELVFIPLAYQ